MRPTEEGFCWYLDKPVEVYGLIPSELSFYKIGDEIAYKVEDTDPDDWGGEILSEEEIKRLRKNDDRIFFGEELHWKKNTEI